jgi:hypothetical protein
LDSPFKKKKKKVRPPPISKDRLGMVEYIFNSSCTGDRGRKIMIKAGPRHKTYTRPYLKNKLKQKELRM